MSACSAVERLRTLTSFNGRTIGARGQDRTQTRRPPHLRVVGRTPSRLSLRLAPSNQPPRQSPRVLAAFKGSNPSLEREIVAQCVLQQACSTGGKISNATRRPQRQAIQVDNVEVGEIAGRDHATIKPTNVARRPLCLLVNDKLYRQPRPPRPSLRPMRQRSGGESAVANKIAVRAAIGQTEQCVRRGHHRTYVLEIAVRVIVERQVEHRRAAIFDQPIICVFQNGFAKPCSFCGERVVWRRLVIRLLAKGKQAIESG